VNSINAGTTAGFVSISAERYPNHERGALADFSLDSRTVNKISIAAALRLPTSQAISNKIDFGMKRILNSF